MGLTTGKLKDEATWWAVTGGNGFGGDAISAPVLIKCRWDEVQEVFIGQIDRRELISKAVVIVDRDMAVGDYLVKGDLTDQASPSGVPGAFKVQRWEKSADLRNADHVRMVVL